MIDRAKIRRGSAAIQEAVEESKPGGVQKLLDRLEERGFDPYEDRKGWMALCPVHGDTVQSLSIDEGEDGQALVYCRSHQCAFEDIVAELDLTPRDLVGGNRHKTDSAKLIEYIYLNADGDPVRKVQRKLNKEFPQAWFDTDAQKWVWKDVAKNAPPLLYRLPEVLEAVKAGETIYVAEGEKDVDRLVEVGVTATCNPGGAGKWKDELSVPLEGAEVVVIRDKDDAGIKHANQVAASLRGRRCTVRIVEAKVGKDAHDHLRMYGLDDFVPLDIDITQPKRERPVLDPRALHGLAGKFIKVVEPESEADPAAMLVQFLCMVGNTFGRGPHVFVNGTRHPCNLFVGVVGASSTGGKGDSLSRVEEVVRHADPDWLKYNTSSGLASGQGLIEYIKDETFEETPACDEQGTPTGEYEREGHGDGIADKRLCVRETEFSNALRLMAKSDSVLSGTVRNLWDRGDAANMTKRSPSKTTNAMVSIIGHITPAELRQELTDSAAANGFGNRFLWVYCDRTKLLPRGGEAFKNLVASDEVVFSILRAKELAELRQHHIELDEEAGALWDAEYERLKTHPETLSGMILSRAAPQVLRLALIYALLDGSPRIRKVQLEAALAVWDYCEQSVPYIWCDASPFRDDEKLLAYIKSGDKGRTTTEVRDLFGRNKDTSPMLDRLADSGKIVKTKIPSGGRPRTVWVAP